MTNPYLLLGIAPDADTDQVRSAYRQKVKECHPDQFQDPQEQKVAQEKLIALNLAYESALSRAPKPQEVNPSSSVPAHQAKAFAQRLAKEGNYHSALRQLIRAETRDAQWFYIQGNILMSMKQYTSAHQSYREAVRLEPNNSLYRQGAFDAAIAMKKEKNLPYRIGSWFKKGFKNKR